MDQRDQELLDKQLRHLNPYPRSDSVMMLAILAVFFAGMALGSFLFAYEGQPLQIASNDAMTATSVPNGTPPTTLRWLFRSVLVFEMPGTIAEWACLQFGFRDWPPRWSDGVSSVRGNRLVQSDKAAPAREIQLRIGEALKAQYDLGLPEPIPDRLGELLKQLAHPMDERDGETG
jgi:Anti-sigma factor NepR